MTRKRRARYYIKERNTASSKASGSTHDEHVKNAHSPSLWNHTNKNSNNFSLTTLLVSFVLSTSAAYFMFRLQDESQRGVAAYDIVSELDCNDERNLVVATLAAERLIEDQEVRELINEVVQLCRSADEIIEDHIASRVTQHLVASRAIPRSIQSHERQAAGEFSVVVPIEGELVAGFGRFENGYRNDGINLAAEPGALVVAAASGTVVYSGDELDGYGNLVLLRHNGGWVTAYAHMQTLFVREGDQVAQGDAIGIVGQTGSVNSRQLHFEIRRGVTPVNPLEFFEL